MESRRRSSRAIADKHDPQDHKPAGVEGIVGPGGLSSEDDAEDMVSITGAGRLVTVCEAYIFFVWRETNVKAVRAWRLRKRTHTGKDESHPRFLFLT